MAMELQINNLKALIDQAYIQADKGGYVADQSLVHANLSAADEALLKARTQSGDRNQNSSKVQFHIARLRLSVAQRHMENKSSATKEKFSGTAQIYTNELAERIVKFKTVAEWMNCPLTEQQKKCFVEVAELFEDALNEMRFYKNGNAEIKALGGLLLQYYLCCTVEEQIPEPLSLMKRTRNKAATTAASIHSLIENLRQVRQLALKSASGAAASGPWTKQFSAAEQSLLAAIDAFTAENDKILKDHTLDVHAAIIKLRNMINIQNERNDSAPAAPELVEDKPKNILLDHKTFNHEAEVVNQAIKDKVDDPELLSLRLQAIQRLYGDLLEMRKYSYSNQTAAVITSIKAELERVKLIYRQAQLFRSER